MVDWMLSRLENCSRSAATHGIAARMTPPPVANEDDGTVGTEHQLTRRERLRELFNRRFSFRHVKRSVPKNQGRPWRGINSGWESSRCDHE